MHRNGYYALFHSQHYNKQRVLGRIFFVVTTLFGLTFNCHSKVNQKAKKKKIIDGSLRMCQTLIDYYTHGKITLPLIFLKKESDVSTLLNPILQLFHAMIIALGFLKT